MDKTCSNCKWWDDKSKSETRECNAFKGYDWAFTAAYMTCPRHEAKIEFPKWTPEFHPASEESKRGIDVLLFCFDKKLKENYCVRAFYSGREWKSNDLIFDELSIPMFWCYLPEGWE